MRKSDSLSAPLFEMPQMSVERLHPEDIITTSGGHVEDDGTIYTPSDELPLE